MVSALALIVEMPFTSVLAQHIAATAAAFGQQDDITVLKIRRHPVPVGAEVLAATEVRGRPVQRNAGPTHPLGER